VVRGVSGELPVTCSARDECFVEVAAGGTIVRLDLQRPAQQPFAFHRVAAKQTRQVQQQRALASKRVRIIGSKCECGVELTAQSPIVRPTTEARSVDAQPLPEIAERRKVRLGIVVVRGDCGVGELQAVRQHGELISTRKLIRLSA